jgi:predicted dehydrogenase
MKGGRRLRVALVGTGDFGAEFARYVNEVAELVAVRDPSAAGSKDMHRNPKRTAVELQRLDQRVALSRKGHRYPADLDSEPVSIPK